MTNLLLRIFVKDYENTASAQVRAAMGTLSGFVGIGCNFLLFMGKLLIGTLAGSVSITADALNNLSDASGSIVTLLGFKMAGKPNNKYSPEFKKEAAEKYLSGKYGGYDVLTRELGLRSSFQLKTWVRKYLLDPELLDQDGRHLGKKDGVQKGKPKKVNLKELSLEEQIEHLKMENAILKKAKALRKNYGEL